MENKVRRPLSLPPSLRLCLRARPRAIKGCGSVNTKNYAPMKISPMLMKVRPEKRESRRLILGASDEIYCGGATRDGEGRRSEGTKSGDLLGATGSAGSYAAPLLIICAEVISITFARWRARHRLIRFTSEFAGERTKPRISAVLDTP